MPQAKDTDTPEFRRGVLESYVDYFNKQDAEALAGLFAERAVVDDPVGKSPRTESVTVRQFFDSVTTRVKRLDMDAPIRGSMSRFAVVPLVFITESNGVWQRVSAIDVMEFNAEGEIVHMQAFHGSEDRRELTAEEAERILVGRPATT